MDVRPSAVSLVPLALAPDEKPERVRPLGPATLSPFDFRDRGTHGLRASLTDVILPNGMLQVSLDVQDHGPRRQERRPGGLDLPPHRPDAGT